MDFRQYINLNRKMADQRWSDLDVVFIMILYAINFFFGKLRSSYSQISFK